MTQNKTKQANKMMFLFRFGIRRLVVQIHSLDYS